VALVARGANVVNNLATEINTAGGHVSRLSIIDFYNAHLEIEQAAPFALPSYSHEDITSTWGSIHAHFPKPEYAIRAAVFNVGHGVWKPFLEVTPQDVQDCLQTTIAAAFAFSRGAILAFRDNKELEEPTGKRGTLIFTGATAALRGNVTTSAFAPGKFGVRALSQSLAKEFGPENIHVAHVSI
jgi:NAD(P)-dependent dehydrogenase (short-subunit alcohol dehydrogenase family)